MIHDRLFIAGKRPSGPSRLRGQSDNPHVLVPPGRYPVSVTLADVSENLDRSEIREAYATVRIAPGTDAYRRALPLALQHESRAPLTDDNVIGFGVDAGTACFVDDEAVVKFMPADVDWYETFRQRS